MPPSISKAATVHYTERLDKQSFQVYLVSAQDRFCPGEITAAREIANALIATKEGGLKETLSKISADLYSNREARADIENQYSQQAIKASLIIQKVCVGADGWVSVWCETPLEEAIQHIVYLTSAVGNSCTISIMR